MSFRLLRVKRRADQDPATALYLPIEDDNKRIKTESSEAKEFRLFKIVDRGDTRQLTKIVKPAERTITSESKVVLLSDSSNTSTVAEAILVDNNDNFKRDISKFIKNNEISDRFDSFNIGDTAEEFVYDVYRLDLGRFTAKDIEGKANCLQIITYEQEFLNDESGSDSEIFQDEDDSNAEDFYANDYPDEESYISDNDDEVDVEGEIIENEDGEFIFNDSFEIDIIDTDAEADDSDFAIDLDSDDYKYADYDSDEFDYTESDGDDSDNCFSAKYCYDDGIVDEGDYDEDM